LIISSPDNELVTYLGNTLQQSWYGAELNIGDMKFKIDYVDKLVPQISRILPTTLISGTPIIIRVPSEKYRDYGLETENKYRYVYWRSDHPIDLFISQVENNLLRKYAEFHKLKSAVTTEVSHGSSLHLFERFRFKKQISTRVFIKGSHQVVIGTVWEITCNAGRDPEIVRFALDAGLGERNSLGFGFMNIITNK
jgi:CRISPR-associated endoribonuclease Cas6